MKLQQKDIEKILSILGYVKINSLVTEFEVTFDDNPNPYLGIYDDNVRWIQCDSGYCVSNFFDDISIPTEFQIFPGEDCIICEVSVSEDNTSKTILRGYYDNQYFNISFSDSIEDSSLLYSLISKIKNKKIIFDEISGEVIFSDRNENIIKKRQ